MMTKLLPSQVSDFWPIIKYAIEQSLPPTVGEHPDKMNRILSAALSNILDVWAVYDRTEEKINMNAILVTKITYDDASSTRALMLYCLYGYDKMSEENWSGSFGGLVKYAKSKGCTRIIAHSSVPYVIERAKELGADAEYTLLSFDISKIV